MKKIEIEKRRDKILLLLKKYKALRVSQLVNQLGVSDETIRSDLKVLAEKNLIIKDFGIASLNIGIKSHLDDEVEKRIRARNDTKTMLARLAVHLLKNKSNLTISLDAGTTIARIATVLSKLSGNKLFTNSLLSLINLRHSQNNEVYCLGGKLNQDDMAFQYGITGLNNENLHYDYSFIGSSGVKGRNGICSTSFADAQMKRQIIAQSDVNIAVIDAQKFTQSSLVSVTSWKNLDYVVTNLDPRSEIFRQISIETRVISNIKGENNEFE